jgi:hypothetical protein
LQSADDLSVFFVDSHLLSSVLPMTHWFDIGNTDEITWLM